MDQLSAHLDRGWDLAQRGDAPGAVACARRALELDPQSPEVHNLLGYTAALSGESEEALEHYRQAMTLDENYFEAMLNAAEVLIAPLEEWDEAILLIEDASELAETPEEVADCVLLKVDALLGKGDREEAKRAMRALPDEPYANASYTFMIGRAYYELGELLLAVPYIEEAARKDPENGDALYYLGLIRDEQSDPRGALEAYLRARAADVARAPVPWSPSADVFANIVQGVVTKLDAVFATYVREADVFIVDVPGAELVVDGIDPRALMLLESPPPRDETEPARARLFVYQRNLERAAGALDAVEEEMLHALEREITAVFLEKEPEAAAADKHRLN
jgi:tetratricopeptide (TPR) repeat protein